MTISVEAFASALGTTTNPYEYLTTAPSAQDLKTIRLFMARSPVYKKNMAQLANGYLPSFLRRLYRTPCDPGTPSSFYGMHDFLAVLNVLVVFPDMARFVRENPADMHAFWLVQVERLSWFPTSFVQIASASGKEIRAHLLRHLMSLHFLHTSLSLYLPQGYPTASFPSSTHQRLVHLAPCLESVRACYDDTDEDPVTLALDLLMRLTLSWPHGMDDEKARAVEGRRWIHKPWIDCDLTNSRELLEKLGKCRPLSTEPRKEMMCGRCGVVRYCCKEHQVLRWKAHKLECLPPVW